MSVTIEMPQAPKDRFTAYDTSEWFNSVGIPSPGLEIPESNEDYFYGGMHLFSFYPIINDRGATYEREDFDDNLLGSLLGKQANLEHDKAKVVGSIVTYNVTTEGIDGVVRVDREQAKIHGLDPEDMKKGNYFSQCSVELTKDPSQSWFYAYDSDYTVKTKIPVLKGREMGMSRTTSANPYLLQGRRVAERIKPARFTGVGFVPNPSDSTAQLFAVNASSTSEDRPIGGPITLASPDASQETNMSQEEAAALQAKLARMEADLVSLKSEKEAASALVVGKEAELAAAISRAEVAEALVASFNAEKEVAAKAAAVDEILAKLEAIHPVKDDAERNSLREVAFAVCGDDGAIRTASVERENVALKAQVEALKPVEKTDEEKAAELAASEAVTKAEADAVVAADAEKAASEKAAALAAATEKEKFSTGIVPETSVVPKYSAPSHIASGKNFISNEDAVAAF